MGRMTERRPVEPPASRWMLPHPEDADADGIVAIGGDLEPGTLLAAYRQRAVPDAVRSTARCLVLTRPSGHHPPRRSPGEPVAAPQHPPFRGPPGRALRRGDGALRRSPPAGGVDHPTLRQGVRATAPSRLGPLLRVPRRRRSAGRRSLRRAHRWPVRRRVDVPHRHRRVEGRARRARRVAQRDRRPAARRAMDDVAPRLARRGDDLSATSTSTSSRRRYNHEHAGSAVADAHLLRPFDGRRVERAVPHQPGEGPDRAVDRLRPAHADRIRPGLADGPWRSRQGRRAHRPPRQPAHAARRHPAGPDEHVDDDQRHGGLAAGAVRRQRRGAGHTASRSCAARRRTTSSRSTCRAGPTSSRPSRRGA